MDKTLRLVKKPVSSRRERLIHSTASFADRAIGTIKLSTPFRANIRRLVLDSQPYLMLDPSFFDNLELVTLISASWFLVKSRDIWEEDGKLLLACRSGVGEFLSSEERPDIGRQPLFQLSASIKHGWILQMVKKLEAEGNNRKVRVILKHEVHNYYSRTMWTDRPLGKVLHDVGGKTITKIA